jgi:hypothetical protein
VPHQKKRKRCSERDLKERQESQKSDLRSLRHQDVQDWLRFLDFKIRQKPTLHLKLFSEEVVFVG